MDSADREKRCQRDVKILTAVVREKSGHGASLDQTIVLTPLSPLDVSGSADSACVEVPVSMPLDSLAFDIALRQWFPNGEYHEATIQDVVIVPEVGNVDQVAIVGGDHSFTVYWDPVENAEEYEVQIAREGGPWCGPIGSGAQDRVSGTTSLEVGQDWTQLPTEMRIQPLNGYVPQMYLVRVRAVSGGTPGEWSDPVDAYAWWPEHGGWPQLVEGGGECSPVLVDIDGDGEAEIFTAGKGMYAWRQDGTAVVGVNPFFEPTDVAGTDQLFVEALAVADIDDDSKFEVVGNMRHRGIFCVELTPSREVLTPRPWNGKGR